MKVVHVLACVLDKTRYFALLSCKWQYGQTPPKRPLKVSCLDGHLREVVA